MSKNVKLIIGIVIVLILLGGSFSGGILIGWFLPKPASEQVFLPPTVEEGEIPAPAQDMTTPDEADGQTDTPLNTPDETQQQSTDFGQTFDVLEEAWNLVHELYVDQPVDDDLLLQGAIRGMMESLGDQHSSYLDPKDYQQLTITQDGSYEGIGAWVDTGGDYVTIISPMAGSPAEKAGVLAGDIIIAIDGEDMSEVDPAAALNNILGPAGTVVTLTVRREGVEDPIDIAIERAEIVVPSVEYRMLDNDIAYIILYNYGENTSQDFEEALQDLLKNDPVGFILDLRGNGGGYLFTAVNITSQFLNSDQIILIEEYGDGTQDEWTAVPGGLVGDLPLVVLVDGGSASASEITAGAIQDYERGLLVGTTTYGKGSVQNIITLSENQGAVRITIAKWLTPNGRHIHGEGLIPDIEVEFDQELYQTDGVDNQLEKAIEVILDQVN